MRGTSLFKEKSLDELIRENVIELGRGEVISRIDIENHPGPFPIYSSSATGEGKFGEYGKYMFDEELISWSVDGGGNFFYRPKHKFSVTNVSGYIRIRSDRLNYRFLYYALVQQHRNLTFDYTTKAHPSVIRKLYSVPVLSKDEQQEIAEILGTVDGAIEKTESLIAKYQQIKAGLMHDLFTRGVTADGKMRPPREQAPELYHETPIGWIPKKWKVKRFTSAWQQVFDFRGRTPLKLGMQWGGDIPALSAMNVKMGEVDLSQETNYGSPALYRRWMTSGNLQRGDVLMTMEAPLGNVAQVPDDKPYILSQRVIAIRFRESEVLNNFSAWLMRSRYFQREIARRSSGTTATGIQRAQLEQIEVAIPDLQEQELIATQLMQIEAKLSNDSAELLKLRQLKTGLMHDLLTGRVPVGASLKSPEMVGG